MWKNNMQAIANIGAMTRPQVRNLPTLDLAGAIDNYYDAKDAADKRAQLAEQAQKQQAYSDALQTGNQDAINQAWAAYDPQGYSSYLNQQQQRAEDRQWQLEDMARKEQFERNLAAIKHGYAMQTAAARGAGGDTNAIRNVAAMVEAGYTPQEAWKMYYGGQNPTLDVSQLGQKGYEAYDKKMGENVADEMIAQKQMKTLRPKLENALLRAEESLKQGSGLGQIGGWGWTSEQGGQNRANIKNAQAQINTTMRGLLKQMGVGSTELNSAVEAEAYRYMLSPDMPIGQQLQVINNFKQDYLSGELAKDLEQTYGNGAISAQYNEGDIAEDANGNRLVFRGGKWQKM